MEILAGEKYKLEYKIYLVDLISRIVLLVFQPKSNQCEFRKFLKVEGRENFETKALQGIHLDGNAPHIHQLLQASSANAMLSKKKEKIHVIREIQ